MRLRSRRFLSTLCVGVCLAAGVAGCVVYETAPGVYAPYPAPNTFDRSWSAAIGAFADEGVQIMQQDPAAGVIRGTVGDIAVAADVRRRTDGSVQVEFGVSGNVAANPRLKDRIVGSYNRRMGR